MHKPHTSAYGRPLKMVNSLKYLGRVILATDDDWLAAMKNLSRSRKVWGRMPRILSREGAAPRVSGFFFKDLIQAVPLFREETWVVTPRVGKALGGFRPRGKDI